MYPLLLASGTINDVALNIANKLIRNTPSNVYDLYLHRKKIIKRFNINKYNLSSLFQSIEQLSEDYCFYCYLESKELVSILNRILNKQISIGEIIALSGFSDLTEFLDNNYVKKSYSRIENDHCSSFINNKHKDSIWIAAGQTWDMPKVYLKHSVLIHRVIGKRSFVTLSLSLGHAHLGMNDQGVVVVINNLKSRERAITGLPFTIIVTKILLEARNAEEGLNILLKAPRLGSHNYIIVDKQGNAYNIEVTPKDYAIYRVSNEIFIHTNHFLHNKFKNTGINYSSSSLSRFSRLKEILEKQERINDETIHKAFSDHVGPICRHSSSNDKVVTIGAAWFKPLSLDMMIIRGNPCMNKYRRYNIGRGREI